MPPPSPIFAFGIANLPMLGWLAAAAAPLLIHLLSRRKYRETSWAAMEYLLAALKRQSRRIHLEQWLLLAVRTLLIVLVVAAVAEPYVEQSGAAFIPGGGIHRVLVLDGSYSMGYRATDKTRFDRAKELAARIVDQSAQGDAFTVVLMAAPSRVIVGTPSVEASQVREEIERLELAHTGADLQATVPVVEQLIDGAHRDNARLDRHEVYFFTDLQQATWAPSLGEAAAAEFRRQSEQLAQSAAIALVDLGQPAVENLAVISLRTGDPNFQTTEPVAIVGRSVTLSAGLKNFGRQPRSQQVVELLVDGRRVGQQTVDVAPGGEASASFIHQFDAPGDHAVEVRAEGDALEVDNHRYLVVAVRQSVRVLCIDGRPSGQALRDAGDYLAAALVPQVEPGVRNRVEVDVAAESALLERDLAGYDCVFLANVAQFTANESRVLDAYLARGGGVVFFLGDQVLADRYNRELGGESGGPRILPARLGPLVAQRQPGLDPLGYRHPIVEAFKGMETAGLLTTAVDKYIRLELPRDSAARVALALANGDPLVVAGPVRRGRVVLVATSADISWTPMPLWPSYLPIVQEILAWCIGGQSQQRNLEVGEPLGSSTAGPASDASISVQRPDGRTQAVQLRTEGDSRSWAYAETGSSGIYTVRFGVGGPRSERFALNLDTAESDLTATSIDELRTTVWPGVPVSYQTTWQRSDVPLAGPGGSSGHLPIGLLYSALGLLFIETFLAWRFGYHST